MPRPTSGHRLLLSGRRHRLARAFPAAARRPRGRAGRGRAGSGRLRSRRCRRSRAPFRRPFVLERGLFSRYRMCISSTNQEQYGISDACSPPETCTPLHGLPGRTRWCKDVSGRPRRLTRARLLPASKNGLLIGLVLGAGMLAGCSTTRLEPAISPLSELGADDDRNLRIQRIRIVLPDEVAVLPSSYAGPTPTEGAGAARLAAACSKARTAPGARRLPRCARGEGARGAGRGHRLGRARHAARSGRPADRQIRRLLRSAGKSGAPGRQAREQLQPARPQPALTGA